jgi:hypothetical protein
MGKLWDYSGAGQILGGRDSTTGKKKDKKAIDPNSPIDSGKARLGDPSRPDAGVRPTTTPLLRSRQNSLNALSTNKGLL